MTNAGAPESHRDAPRNGVANGLDSNPRGIASSAPFQTTTPISPHQPTDSELASKSKPPNPFSFKGRMLALAIIMLLPCPLIIARLYELQVIRHEEFNDLVKNKQQRIIITPPVRGQIYSSDGIILAGNRAHYDLTIYPSQMDTGYNFFTTSNAILKIATDLEVNLLKRSNDIKNMKTLRDQLRRDMAHPVVIFKDLTEEEIAKCADLMPLPKGGAIETRIEREYPMPGIATHILGITKWQQRPIPNKNTYSSMEISGVNGLEKRFNNELAGRTGFKTVLNDPSGFVFDELPDSIDKIDGFNLILTLDSKAQAAADEALAEAVINYGENSMPMDYMTGRPPVFGALVALDIHTGAVLAIASSPTYDLSTMTPSMHAQFSKDTQINRLFNRALLGEYMPGSIIKPLVALAALEKGTLDQHSPYTCLGYYTIGNSRISCARTYGHGELEMMEAIAVSCNPFFINAGILCTIDVLQPMYAAAGIGENPGFELRTQTGLLPAKNLKATKRWTNTDTAFVSIGQGSILLTPLQAACYAAALGNGGTLWRPHLVKRFVSKDGLVISETTPLKRRELPVTQEHLKIVQKSMEMAVTGPSASANAMSLAPVAVAAKTGTAEITPPNAKKRKNTWIICYGPLPNPVFAVACVLEYGASGGKTTAPVVVNFLNKWLGTL